MYSRRGFELCTIGFIRAPNDVKIHGSLVSFLRYPQEYNVKELK
jgi:hypothetical protein